MLFLPVSGAIDPTSPDQSSAASALARFVLAGPEAAAAAAEHCADLLTAEEVSRLRNLDFSVTLTSKQTLSLTLLAIADWVLAPQVGAPSGAWVLHPKAVILAVSTSFLM